MHRVGLLCAWCMECTLLLLLKSNTAGGSPAASHFLLRRQKESNPRKGAPGLPPLRGTLRCSTGQAAAELALRAQT